MPLCIACNTSFSRAGEKEPCDCGAGLTRQDIEDMTPEEYERLMHPDVPCSRCGQDVSMDGGCRTCYERDHCESPRLSETGQF